jgi:hypothetical protein
LVARLAAGVLAWGGVVERGCRAADARRATSTAAPSSVSFPGPRHRPLLLPPPLRHLPLGRRLLWNTFSGHQSVNFTGLKECGRRLAACGLFRLRLRASDQPWGRGIRRSARECRADPAASSTAASSTRQAAAGGAFWNLLEQPPLTPFVPCRRCRRGASRTCARTPAPPPSSPGPSVSRRRTRCVSCASMGARRYCGDRDSSSPFFSMSEEMA